jgi:2-polyprenyl-3-methyl-5-hydroxy-6-metoxy-1,4-benzoquinol methylase
MESLNVNEKYHLHSKIQKKIITNKNFTYRILLQIIDRYVSTKKKIADLGSGVGTLDFYLASRGNFISGFEYSKIAVKIAKMNAINFRLNNKIKYSRVDINKINNDNSFDVVLMTEVIEHVLDDQKVLKLANKILKKNGIIIITTRSSNALLFTTGFSKLHDKNVGHIRRYTFSSLKKIVKENKFELLEKGKTEGLLRDILFSYPIFGSQIVRMANKFALISDLLTIVDNITLKLFGESQIYIVAKKC